MEILLVDDERTIRRSLTDLFRDAGHDVTSASDGATALAMLRERPFDLVLSDVRMPRASGFDVFRYAREQHPSTDVVLMTAFGDVEEAVSAMKDGLLDYLVKPIDLDHLELIVGRTEERRAMYRRGRVAFSPPSSQHPDCEILGRSVAHRAMMEHVALMAESEAPVLITGETGTGKELVARRIHDLSARAAGAFVPINCAALPESLIEAELFGHEEGAFTGANQSRPGRFVVASGGTLFLDEIADMPMAAQAKLLRVIHEGQVEQLGSDEPTLVNVRIVSATHRHLRQRIQQGLFREDLFYRLNVLDVAVPPLRERTGDIALLTKAFLHRFAPKGQAPQRPTRRAWQALLHHRYPGNVRELMHAIQRASILAGDGPIDLEHLPRAIRGDDDRRELEGDSSLKSAVRRAEREHIQWVLDQAKGRKVAAAELLGVSRKTLWEKIRLYGLDDVPTQDPSSKRTDVEE